NGCAGCLARGSFCALKKKAEPFFPNAFGTNSLKQIVVALTVSLEVKTQIEERFTQSAFGTEKQRNQQTAKSSVAVEKGMDRFELHVDESRLDKNREFVFFVVKEMLEEDQTLHHAFRWRGNKCSVSRTATANPILRAAKFAGCFVRSASPSQQNSVNLANEPQRKRKTPFDETKTV
ncbi:MAG: hypothetical protein QOJ41_3108, partial [Acidobacteriaceae bacterium]|nr:hypothetical protein [Acidobacteriaceae bacterium]